MESLPLTKKDEAQLEAHGISKAEIIQQIETFRKDIHYVSLISAAKIGDGILQLKETQKRQYISLYEDSSLQTLKFVPASGAATRMFKYLHRFLEEYQPEEQNLEDFLNQTGQEQPKLFFEYLKHFAFYDEVLKELERIEPDYKSYPWGKQYILFAKTLLTKEGLDYSNLPKGLVPFHQYKKEVHTAFEEHLWEAAIYASDNGKARLHFTVTQESIEKFKVVFEKIEQRVSDATGILFQISYSVQKKSTNTIAVNNDNTPFRKSDGSLYFRPGGHGALIENLNEMHDDLIFIKNIDNVVVEKNLEVVADYKKALAGILISVQKQCFELLEKIDHNNFTASDLCKANELLQEKLSLKTELTSELEVKKLLNRPIRVCGMVKNEGAPGGGPFWVKDAEGQVSLQIVEGAQIDADNVNQKSILENATHFNPVDLVCGVRNYQGKKFDLNNFVDSEKGIITRKTSEGKPLKALELPGLWNGGMAFWNTIFVEVPLVTFNPVKTVTDLLKPAHQTEYAKSGFED